MLLPLELSNSTACSLNSWLYTLLFICDFPFHHEIILPFLVDTVSTFSGEVLVQPWAAEVAKTGSTLHLTASDSAAARGALPAILAPLGERLLRYEQVRPTLEDVFARLVEQVGEEAA